MLIVKVSQEILPDKQVKLVSGVEKLGVYPNKYESYVRKMFKRMLRSKRN